MFAEGGRRKGAGRKGFYDEAMVKKIMDFSNKTILETLEGKGRFSNINPEIIVEIACRFSLKGVPQIVDLETNENSYATITHVFEGLDAGAREQLSEYFRQRALRRISPEVSEVRQIEHTDKIG